MSPKSRGRPPARGRAKPRQDRPLRTPTAADRVLSGAGDLARSGVLDAEMWASEHLGWAWAGASPREGDAEARLVRAVAERVRTRPGLLGASALAALVRLADPATPGLGELLADLPPAPWAGAAWVPGRALWAWVVYSTERLVCVEFGGPDPHILMASVDEVGGRWVTELEVLDAHAYPELLGYTDPGTPGLLPSEECPPGPALAYLAEAMRQTDLMLPRHDDPDYVELRALAWERCRGHLAAPAPYVGIEEAERAALVTAFLAAAPVPDSKVVRSLAGRLVDYGDAWLPDRPLGWSPGAVGHFLDHWLETADALADDEFAAVPDVLAAWVRFALTTRGLAAEWVDRAVEVVEASRPDFEAGNEQTLWGPAREVAAQLRARGVDLADHDAVAAALKDINAEFLAQDR